MILLLIFLIFVHWLTAKPNNFPPGPPCLPFLGTTPFMPLDRFASYLENVRERFGPLVGLKMGWTNLVGVTGMKESHEILTKPEYQGRPPLEFPRTRWNDHGQNMNILIKFIRTYLSWENIQRAVEIEGRHLLQKIKDDVETIQMNDTVRAVVFNIVMNTFRMNLNEEIQNSEDEKLLSDLFSFLMNKNNSIDPEKKEDLNKSEMVLEVFEDLIQKQSILISNNLEYCLLYCTTCPEYQNKILKDLKKWNKNGIESYLGGHERYSKIKALLTEVKRCDVLAAIAVPHKAIEDTKLNGYTIPQNTVFFISAKSFLKGSSEWRNPELFKPERHLNKDGKFEIEEEWKSLFLFGKNLHDELLPVDQISFLILIVLLEKFKFERCDGVEGLSLEKFTKAPERTFVKLEKRHLTNGSPIE